MQYEHKLMFTKDLISTYDMPVFGVDFVKDAYNTQDPFKIQEKLKEVFDINLSIQNIIKCLTEDAFASESHFLKFEDL